MGIMADRAKARMRVTAEPAAYHGSPYDFDEFSTAKIGTGEGNQSYGFGLYFAGNKEVADWYKSKLSKWEFDGLLLNNWLKKNPPDLSADAEYTDTRSAILAMRETGGNIVAAKFLHPKSSKKIDQLMQEGRLKNRGHTYEVSIAPTEDKFLDWDKPLSKQPPAIERIAMRYAKPLAKELKRFASNPVNEYTGEETIWTNLYGENLYKIMSAVLGSQRKASAELLAAGIPGIIYLDATSRGAGAGSHNYVVFDEKDVKITKKAAKATASSDDGYLPSIDEVLSMMDDVRSYSGSFDDLFKGYSKQPEEDDEYEYDSEEKARDFAQLVLDILGDLPDPTPIYRAIKAESVESIDKGSLGESWAFEKNAALEFGSHNGSNYLLQALAPRDAINWFESANRFCENSRDPFSGEAEMELVVSDESRLFDLEIYQIKGMKRVAMRIISSSDSEYMAVVEAGDMEAAQRMVEEAAREKGYTIKAYHGTNSKFNVFKAQIGKAIWFSEDKDKIARGESGAQGTQRIIPVFLKAENPAGWEEYEKLLEMQILSAGFDSVHLDDDWIVYSPKQIKSAETIVRDNFGNIIPLSRRFNSASNDIRAARYYTRSPEESEQVVEEGRVQSLWGMEIQDALIRDGWVRKGTMTGAPQQITKNGGSAYFQFSGAKIRVSDHNSGRTPYGYNVIDYTVSGKNLPVDEDHERRHFPPGTSIDEVLRWANSLPEGRGTQASRHTMNLQEKYKALRASGRISATGRTEEILAEDDWVRVKRMAVPEIDADSYIFTECKRETAVCIVRDADGRYLMRNEATLQSNFTPAPKVMTETLEEGETAEQAVYRGIKEEFGIENTGDAIYLGSINGTFQELHNYHIYLMDWSDTPIGFDADFEGDGSRGEDRSNNVFITEEEWAQVKDFISWIAFGMMKQYDNRNILERTVLCQ